MKQAVHLITWNIGLGGIEATIPNYLNHLSDQFDFTVFSLRPKAEKTMLDNCQYQLVEGSSSTKEVYKKLYRYAKAHPNDAFHLFNGGPISLSMLRAAGVQNILYHIHGTRYWQPNDLVDKIKNKILWKTALLGDLSNIRFIANSKYSKQRYQEQVSYKPEFDVVYNGFDFSGFNFKKAPRGDEFKIVVVGRLVDYKNLLRLIKESEVLFQKIPNCKIYFVGSGDFKSTMEAAINQRGLQDRFVFTGFLSSYEQIYQDASAVVSVSYSESFGNTLVEAILSGTPIFASDIPAHKEILEQLPESIIALEGNLADQLAERIRNIDFFKQKTQGLKRVFQQKFSVENHLRHFIHYYSQT